MTENRVSSWEWMGTLYIFGWRCACWDSFKNPSGTFPEVKNPFSIPDRVQMILQPYTILDNENPYPIPDLLFLHI